MAETTRPRAAPRRRSAGSTRRRPGTRAYIAVSVMLLAWTGVIALTGDRVLPGRLGIYLAPWLMLFAGGMAGLGLWFGTWRISAALAMIAAGFWIALWPGPGTGAPPGPAAPDAPRITVLTLSHRLGNPDLHDTASFLRHAAADVIALQEVPDPNRMAALLPGFHNCASGPMMLLSRWPLGPPRPESTPRQLFCEGDSPAGPVLLASVHLPKARFDPAHQQRGMARLMTTLAAVDRPMIMAGDFNTTPLTEPYRAIRRHLEDAHAQAGTGLGMTFPTSARPLLGLLGPFLRIDHIFHSPGFMAEHAEVLAEHPPRADHFPVRAVLVPRP